MSQIRKVVANCGLLRVVQETCWDEHSRSQQEMFHVELEGEGVLHSFGCLEMALSEVEAIIATDQPSLDG